jgi:glycosyltransferase involved in cell wall biosynthesis
VALSHWLADCVRKSPLLQHYPLKIIPNGLDPKQYHPVDQAIAKNLLGLPSDKIIILFGAMQATRDRRKGFPILQEALTKLSQTEWQDKLQILIFGASEPENAPDFGLPTQYLGQLHDHLSLRLVYSAADVFLAPSLEDNLPNTVLEALTCGTPCVAFNIGGMPDLIQHQKNGYLAEPFNVDDFVAGIIWFCIKSQNYSTLNRNTFYNLETNFSQKEQVKYYQSLLENL